MKIIFCIVLAIVVICLAQSVIVAPPKTPTNILVTSTNSASANSTPTYISPALNISALNPTPNAWEFKYLSCKNEVQGFNSGSAGVGVVLPNLKSYSRGDYKDVSLPTCSSGAFDAKTLSYVICYQNTIRGLDHYAYLDIVRSYGVTNPNSINTENHVDEGFPNLPYIISEITMILNTTTVVKNFVGPTFNITSFVPSL